MAAARQAATVVGRRCGAEYLPSLKTSHANVRLRRDGRYMPYDRRIGFRRTSLLGACGLTLGRRLGLRLILRLKAGQQLDQLGLMKAADEALAELRLALEMPAV